VGWTRYRSPFIAALWGKYNGERKVDSWVLKQLRALVLLDLKDHIPDGYFETKLDKLELNNTFIHGWPSHDRKFYRKPTILARTHRC